MFDLILPTLTSCSPIWTPAWGHLEPSWAHPGAALGDLGPILGPSWAYLGPLLGHLGPSWGYLGAMLGPLRLIWKAFWTFICHLRATFHVNRLSWALLGPLSSPLGPSGALFGPIWAHLEASFGPSCGLCWDIFFFLANHSPQVSKGGRRCIAAGVFDNLAKASLG